MMDGRAALQYVRQTGLRRQWQLGSTNWLMGMADRDAAGGIIQLRAMVSAEPATLTSMGYPLLLQVAQPYRGGTLTDRQHPHELLSELALRYARPLRSRAGVELYIAAAGEPALGPVAYRHRASAANDPATPLGHHAQDVTHTTFGVATVGLFAPRVKLEGSVFNGRHSDEGRTGLDLKAARMDSWSARFTVNPAASTSLSASYARFASDPGSGHPAAHGVARRVTASLTHVGARSSERVVSTSVVYGVNLRDGGAAPLPALLIESNIDLGRAAIFGRAERVRRSAEELALTGSVPPELTAHALSLGLARSIHRSAGVDLGVSTRATLNLLPRELGPFYGGTRPLGFIAVVYVRPVPMQLR